MYEQFIEHDNGEQTLSEIESTLDPAEKILARRNSLIKTRGKRDGQYVYMLVTPIVRDSLRLLIENRSKMGILEENQYLFAIAGLPNSHLRGDVVIAKLANDCELRDRKSFTSTSLRKYLATTIQVKT